MGMTASFGHSATRRDLLRLLALASLATAALPALSSCGGSSVSRGGVDLVSSDAERADADPDAIAPVVTSLSQFAGAVYGELSSMDGNLALSPYSIAVALAMTLNGAKGETADQMRTALQLGSLDVAAENAGLNALSTELEALQGPVETDHKGDEIKLSSASALFGEETMSWRTAFLDALATSYGAGMRTVDFMHDPDRAGSLINDWVAARTADKIPELIPAGTLDALTRLVLVNALYFKAPWRHRFEEGVTSPGDFHLLDGTTVQVPLMHTGLSAQVSAGTGWQSLAIPYAGSTLAMTIVLPDAGRLDQVEQELSRGGLPTMLQPGGDQQVTLTLPKWKFRTSAALKPALTALGMRLPFDGGAADFTAMSDLAAKEGLHIADVLHQVFIAVDEDGTEAAAATAVVVAGTSAPARMVEFTVDRPFLFVIHDVAHRTPLFLGRVVDPTATDE